MKTSDQSAYIKFGQRSGLTAESAGASRRCREIESVRNQVTDKAEEILGFLTDTTLNVEPFFDAAHAEDRENPRLTMEKSCGEMKPMGLNPLSCTSHYWGVLYPGFDPILHRPVSFPCDGRHD